MDLTSLAHPAGYHVISLSRRAEEGLECVSFTPFHLVSGLCCFLGVVLGGCFVWFGAFLSCVEVPGTFANYCIASFNTYEHL